MKYREEIDGLRALAVFPVVFYHAGFNFFSGGFVGVDIFFVISGYLIATLILEDVIAGNFSIARFYERRARRILPALFCVMALCFPVAWYLLPASDLFEFSQSVQAVVLFLSNYLFMDKSGYFDAAAELKPLLHTWSLAVEEQYYAIFPLLLLTSYRYLKINGLKLILILFIFATFVASQVAIKLAPTFSFFSLPTRSWELLIGALVAISLIQNQKETDRVIAQSASLIGALGIAVSITCLNEAYEFIHKASVTYEQHLSLQRFNRAVFDRVSIEKGVKLLNPDSYFCNLTVCNFGTVESTYYSDANHLSMDGLQKIRELIETNFVNKQPGS